MPIDRIQGYEVLMTLFDGEVAPLKVSGQ